jgi:hypothetical protein
MQCNRSKEGLAGKLSSCKISENSLDYVFAYFKAHSLTYLPHRASLCSLPSSLASRTSHVGLVCARERDTVQRSSLLPTRTCSERRLDVAPVRKAGHSSPRPFSRKICVLPQATGGFWNLCEVTGLVFVGDSCRMSFSVKVNKAATFVSSCKHKRARCFFSPILLAC